MNKLFKFSSQLLAAALFVATPVFTSCDKEENDPFGLLTMSLTQPNGVSVQCDVNQELFAVNATVEAGIPASMYQMTVEYTATLETAISYNGKAVESGKTVIDFSQPVTLVATKEFKKGSKTVNYTVTVIEDANDASNTSGKLVNSDMTKAGFPQAAWFDVAYFKNAFYAITASYPEGTSAENTAYYNVYKSDDGIKWNKVNTSIKAVGAYGARLVEFNGKLFAYGGGKYYGTDENGNAPEMMFGMFPDITKFFAFSTTDGTNWKEEELVTPEIFMSGYIEPRILPFGGNLLQLGGFSCMFGQIQNGWGYATSKDGITWTNDPDETRTIQGGGDYSKQMGAAVYAFKGKIFQAGGFKNFVGAGEDPTYVNKGVWSTADGKNWTLAAEDGGFGAMWNMRVAGTDDVLYMVGGEMYAEDGSIVTSNKVFRSTDGIKWTELTGENAMPATYKGRSRANIVACDDMLWIFGGRQAATSGYYAGPDATDEVYFDTWKKRIK